MTHNPNSRKPTARELVAARQVKVPTASPAKPPTAASTVRPQTTAVAVPDNRSYRARYLDEVAPSGIAGRLIKFDKSGKYVTSDDGAEISATRLAPPLWATEYRLIAAPREWPITA